MTINNNTLDQLANKLIKALTGVELLPANMVQGSTDKASHRSSGMAADAFDQGRIDQAALIDQYHWYWDRGLELETMDTEDKLLAMGRSYHQQKAQHMARLGNWVKNQDCYWGETEEAAKNEKRLKGMQWSIRQAYKDFDQSFVPYEDEITVIDRYSCSEATLCYIRDNVAKWDEGQCAFSLDRLDELKATKSIRKKDYQVAKGHLLRKLAKDAPAEYQVPKISLRGYSYMATMSTEWANDLQSTYELYRESDIKAPGYDDRFFGTVKIDIEAVIDVRREQSHLTMDEAIYCTQAAMEHNTNPETFIAGQYLDDII